jgi:HlyD family secretion protein
MGSDGLGSTSSSLMGGSNGGGGGSSGGGGGGSDFGLVLQDAAKPGSTVRKGDVVAEFDRQYMLNRLEDYRASVAQIEASVRKLQAELQVEKEAHAQTVEKAKATLDKAQLDLKTTPVLGLIDSERIKLAAEEADARYKQYLAEVKFVEAGQRAQLRNAEIDLQQAQIELKRAEANADRMLLKAPINGMIVMQTMFRGSEFAQIQPGDQLYPGMMFMQIVDPSSMIVNATVNQVDVDNLRIGAKTKVRFDAYPGLELPAHIYSIAAMTRPGGQRGSFVKEIPVVLKLDQIDPRVIPDLSVSADVVIEQEDNTTIAPVSAVFTSKDSTLASPYVYVRNGDAWEKREVELGVANNIAVSVRSGLKPGEVVATDLPPLTNKKEQG